jgi:hypothetical protein
MTGSSLVVVAAFLFGLWELYGVFRAPQDSGYGSLFAALFIGGGIYAMWQILRDYSDTVVSLDVGDGKALISVWRPFVPLRIDAPLDRLGNWRFEVRSVGNARVPTALADHRDYPRALRFELGSGIAISDQFRALAPEAVASFEKSAAPAA